MQKSLTAVVMLLVLGAGGFFGFQQYQTIQTRRATEARQAAEAARVRNQQAAAAAAYKVLQQKLAAEHLSIDATLKAMKVSSILLGQPSMVIINKNDYSVGDAIPLPDGKAVRITSIREDGILLACNGQAYRLDAPTAPDLAASRKAR